MVINVIIKDGNTRRTATVTPQGELITRSAEYSTASKKQIIDSNAVNFFKPLSGKKFIVSGMIINTDRNVGVNGSLIEVYETTSETSTSITSDIIAIDQAKNVTSPLIPLEIETAEGSFINGKADDFNVNVTVLGYFVVV